MSRFRPILFALSLVLVVTVPVAGQEELEIDYGKAQRNRNTAPPTSRPAAPEPPPELLPPETEAEPAEPEPEAATTEKGARRPSRNDPDWTPADRRRNDRRPPGGTPPPPPVEDDLARAASAAAAKAVTVAAADGRRQAYEMGFDRGLRQAVDDPRIGAWAREAGRRDGRYDPEARREGEARGRAAARVEAESAAAEDVREQFLDLAVEPRPRFRSGPPRWSGPELRIGEPQLDDVFRLKGAGRELSVQPWDLYRRTSVRQVGDDRWRDPDVYLRAWLEDRRNRAYFRGLPEPEQRRFRDVYVARFRSGLRYLGDDLRRAYGRGFDAGWDYGVEVREEHAWRQGYREGFAQAVGEAAASAYAETFSYSYRDVYEREFESWSTEPHPALAGLEVADADDDGVVSPGEPIAVRYTVVNYGGGSGRLVARLEAAELLAPVERTIFLPRRREIAGEPLEARIDPSVPPRTVTELRLSLGDAEERLSLRIAHPLELDRNVDLEGLDPLRGRATLAATVTNASRRAVAADVYAVSSDGAGPRGGIRARDLRGGDRIPAGRSRRVTFDLAGLRPLDLLGGRGTVRIVAESGREVHDEVEYRFPAIALDLARPDLDDYLIELARSPDPPRADVQEAHRLFLERLRRDFEAASSSEGNPYRRDREDEAAGTALGQLVAAYRRHRPELRRPEVVTALRPKIEELADDLPGVHPFLKSQLKKLARELR